MTELVELRTIIDSALSAQQAIRQNPDRPCPQDMLDSQSLLSVEYIGFDANLHKGQIVIDKAVGKEVMEFFRLALDMEFPIAKVVPLSHPDYLWSGHKVLSDNVSAGFDFRPIKDTKKLSLHSYGRAMDINPEQNPYILYKHDKKIVYPKGAVWDPNAPGTLTSDHPLVLLMENYGWQWGGHWTPESGRSDYQHFQKPI